MTKKKFAIALVISVFAGIACNSNSTQSNNNDTGTTASTETPSENTDATKGVGKYQHVELTHPLDEKMIAQGKSVYDLKCSSCHKLTSERLVGPGWKGVTDRRTPEWIMNFVTNTAEMLQKDTAAQNLLEVCLVQMPNQNLSETDARDVLEFMRQNDGKK